MNKYLTTLLTLIISLFSINALAFSPPEPNGYVTDMAGKLSQDQINQLNSKLNSVNQTTKNEYAALIVPSMDGETIEQVAQQTFDKWKVGKTGLDNGVLVVIAVAERKSRIQTGAGVEGDLPDIVCNDILRQNLRPFLQRGDFFGGLNATFDAINSHIESRHNAKATPAASPSSDNSSSGWGIALFLLGIVFVVGIIALVVNYFQRREEEAHRSRQQELDDFLAEDRRQRSYSTTTSNAVAAGAVGAGLGVGAGLAVGAALEHERQAKERRERERREESYTPPTYSPPSYSSDDSSSSSSSSSSDWGSGSSGSDFGGFGGGDSGGGGSSSDW